MNASPLAGKVAVVTGGGQGIGQAIVEELARDGASIAILEVNPETAADEVRRLQVEGVHARSYLADVSESDESMPRSQRRSPISAVSTSS